MIENVPIDFFILNCSGDQKEQVKLKWRLWNFVNNFDGTKHDAFYEFSILPDVFLSEMTIRDLYYKVKRDTEIV